MKLNVKIPTLDEEFLYLARELLPKQDLYKKKGYNPEVLSPERLRNKKEFAKIYKKSDYRKAAKEVRKIKDKWEETAKIARYLNKSRGFEIYPNYEIRLTLYGTGGDYFPSYGAFDGKFRPQPGSNKKLKDRAVILLRVNKKAEFSKKPEEIIIHELVHLGIENSVVRKRKLSHEQKEKLVDYICKKYFSRQFAKPIFIIEHLEPKLWPWCLIEYENISKIVGNDSLWFTNIKSRDAGKLKKFGKVFTKSVRAMGLKDVCVLDPETPKLLGPDDGKRFKYFVFGGILGDYPPKKRTRKELTQFLPDAAVRNIGKEQFPTDNAVYVTKKIVDGRKFNELGFKDKIEVKIDKFSSIELPFRYVLVDGKPLISKKIVDYLRKKKDF